MVRGVARQKVVRQTGLRWEQMMRRSGAGRGGAGKSRQCRREGRAGNNIIQHGDTPQATTERATNSMNESSKTHSKGMDKNVLQHHRGCKSSQ